MGPSRNLFAAGPLARLRRFARDPFLLAFDFDGTLAPLVAHPDASVPRPETTRSLAELVRRYPVAIITGRAVADLRARLGVDVTAIVGNHGTEPSSVMEAAARDILQWRDLLAGLLAAAPEVRLEDKRLSLSLHYRGARDRAAALAAIREAVAALPAAARATEGDLVVNVVARYAPTKGDALRRLEREASASGSLFVGDDITDEDAFAAQDPAVSMGVRVGAGAPTHAAYHIPSQQDIDRLLGVLLEARS